MNKSFGAINSRGFSSRIQEGFLPESTHLTYEGVFNELKYDVGKKTNKQVDLHFQYARYQFPHSAHDSNINDFLAIFVKGQSDGKERDHRRLNSIICLDISGSMSSPLTTSLEGKGEARLTLSKQAIKMFISRLRPDDSVGIVVFDTSAETILAQTYKKDVENTIFNDIDKIQTRGGTSIRSGFQHSLQQMKKWLQNNSTQTCENRIIMLTDVNDNSIQGEKSFIESASQQSNINLTIIGISNQFKSHVCENLKDVRGFNYFCAVNNGDIKKNIFQEFDFNFFPSVYNLEINISSKDIKSFQVYGVPDGDKAAQYNLLFQKQMEKYVITRVKSSFPSAIEIVSDKIFTFGGLILVKLKRWSKHPIFQAHVQTAYECPNGSKQTQQFPIMFQFHGDQQFFSHESMREAIEGFIFVSQLKHLLHESKSMKNKSDIYDKYWKILVQLQRFTPKSKQQDLKNIKNIVYKLKNHELQKI